MVLHCMNEHPTRIVSPALPRTVLHISPHVQVPGFVQDLYHQSTLMSGKEWSHFTLLDYTKLYTKIHASIRSTLFGLFTVLKNALPWNNWISFLFFLLFFSGTLIIHTLDLSNIPSIYFNLFFIFFLLVILLSHWVTFWVMFLVLSSHPVIIFSIAYNLTFNHSWKV